MLKTDANISDTPDYALTKSAVVAGSHLHHTNQKWPACNAGDDI